MGEGGTGGEVLGRLLGVADDEVLGVADGTADGEVLGDALVLLRVARGLVGPGTAAFVPVQPAGLVAFADLVPGDGRAPGVVALADAGLGGGPLDDALRNTPVVSSTTSAATVGTQHFHRYRALKQQVHRRPHLADAANLQMRACGVTEAACPLPDCCPPARNTLLGPAVAALARFAERLPSHALRVHLRQERRARRR